MTVDIYSKFSAIYLLLWVICIDLILINSLSIYLIFENQLFLIVINIMFIMCKVNKFLQFFMLEILKTALIIRNEKQR